MAQVVQVRSLVGRTPFYEATDDEPKPEADQGEHEDEPGVVDVHQPAPGPKLLVLPVCQKFWMYGRARSSMGAMSDRIVSNAAGTRTAPPTPIPRAIVFERGTTPSSALGALRCSTSPITERSTTGETTSNSSSHCESAKR